MDTSTASNMTPKTPGEFVTMVRRQVIASMGEARGKVALTQHSSFIRTSARLAFLTTDGEWSPEKRNPSTIAKLIERLATPARADATEQMIDDAYLMGHHDGFHGYDAVAPLLSSRAEYDAYQRGCADGAAAARR